MESERDNGEAALPNLATVRSRAALDVAGNPTLEHIQATTRGMSLRQWYAGLAMQSLISLSPSFVAQFRNQGCPESELDEAILCGIVRRAFDFADALIAQGKEQP